MSELPPRNLGRYRLEAKLGEGATAEVWKAFDPRTDRHVAVKLLQPVFTRSAEYLHRFLREARAAGALLHPHIVQVFDVADEDDSAPAIIMELVEGPSLAELLKREGRLRPEHARQLLIQIAEGIGFAHARGRVHRDLKPSNILLTPDLATAKIADFGIAQIAREAGQLTQTGQFIGTPCYMAPEQVQGKQVDTYTDLFALGAVAYEMLSGAKAFDAANLAALSHQICWAEPRPLLERVPELPASLADAVHRLLQKQPKDRFHSAAEFAAALKAEAGPVPEGPGKRAKARKAARTGMNIGRERKRRWPLVVGGAGVILVGAGLTAIYLAPLPPPPELPPLSGGTAPIPAGSHDQHAGSETERLAAEEIARQLAEQQAATEPTRDEASTKLAEQARLRAEERQQAERQQSAERQAVARQEGDEEERRRLNEALVARLREQQSAGSTTPSEAPPQPATGPDTPQPDTAGAASNSMSPAPQVAALDQEERRGTEPGRPPVRSWREAWIEVAAETVRLPCARIEVASLGNPAVGRSPVLEAVSTDASRGILEALVGRLPDTPELKLDILPPDSTQCAMLELLAGYTLPSPVRLISLVSPHRDRHIAVQDGMSLLVSRPQEPSWMTVDYLMADGSTHHMLDIKGPVGQPEQGGGTFVLKTSLGPPFGRELLLVTAASASLFDAPRPRTEPTTAYIEALGKALRAFRGSQRPVASVLSIETAAGTAP